MLYLDELEWKMGLQQIEDQAGSAVAGVTHDFQGLQLAYIDEAQQPIDIAFENIFFNTIPRCV